MAASEAILTLALKMLGWDAGSDQAKAFRKEVESLETSGKDTASAMRQAAAAIDETGQAERVVAQVSSEVAAGLRQVGDVAVQTGQEAAAAARQHANAHEEVVAAARQEGEAVEQAADASATANKRAAEAVDKLAAEYVEFANEVRSSGATLESQIKVLSEYETRLKSVVAGEKEFADGSETASKAAAQALGQVTAQVEDVKRALRLIEADSALERLKEEVVTTDAAFENAVAAILKVRAEIDETGRVSERSIGRAAQAVENYRITVAESEGSIDGARAEEVARLEQLEKHLATVTQRANALTNAAKDNAVRLRETGNQIGAVGLAAQDLGRLAGPAGEKLGNLAAQGGLLAVNFEQAKDAIGGLNINQIGAAKGAAGLAAQVAAVVAAVYGSVAAGKAISETNAENSESWEVLKKNLAEILPHFSNVKDKIGATQSEIAKLVSGGGSIRALDVAMSSGGDAAKIYYNLINAGVPSVQAEEAAIENAAEATKAYTQAKQLGAAGIRLWDEAVRNSGGTADGFARELKVLKIQLDEETRISGLAAVAQKEYAASHRDSATALSGHTAEVAKLRTEESLLHAETAQTAVETVLLEKAINGSTEAISTAAHSIGTYASESDRNSVALSNLAAALEKAASLVDNMSARERARIKETVELARRGDELNAVERERLELLAKQLERFEPVADLLRAQTDATVSLTEATRANSAAVSEGAIIDDARTLQIKGQLDIIREVIAQREQEENRTRRLADANQFAGDSLDWLRAKEEALTRELEPQLTVWHATEKATTDATEAKQGHVAALDAERVAADGARVSHEKIQAVVVNGKTVYTNLSEAERDATTQLASLARQSEDTAKTFGDVFAVKLNDGRVVIVNSVQAVNDFNAGLDALEERAERARGTIAKMNDEIERTGRVSRESAGEQ